MGAKIRKDGSIFTKEAYEVARKFKGKFVVYMITWPDGESYIGSTVHIGQRYIRHSASWGTEFEVKILHVLRSRESMLKHEASAVARLRPEKNSTLNGQGSGELTEAAKARRKISASRPEIRAKRSRSAVRLFSDNEFRERHKSAVSEGIKTAWADPEYRARRSVAVAAYWGIPENRERRAAAIRAGWARRKASA